MSGSHTAKKKKFNDDLSVPDDKTSVVRGGTFTDQIQQAALNPPSLVMLVGPQEHIGHQWPIDDQDLIIGRSMTSSIFVNDKSVSKSHSKISYVKGEVVLVDLESTNKTVINGQTVPPFVPIKLHNNDQIKVGNILFKYLEKGSIEAAATQNLQTKSEKDPLTLAWNKRALIQRGPESVQRARFLEVPLSVAIFDIDYFKKINDNYGHAAGDFILRELAATVAGGLIRGDDYFARFGGEEFVVILFGSALRQAEEIGERIRATVEAHQFTFENRLIPVTVSVGVAELQSTSQEWESLFKIADEALYESKQCGRNCVTVKT